MLTPVARACFPFQFLTPSVLRCLHPMPMMLALFRELYSALRRMRPPPEGRSRSPCPQRPERKGMSFPPFLFIHVSLNMPIVPGWWQRWLPSSVGYRPAAKAQVGRRACYLSATCCVAAWLVRANWVEQMGTTVELSDTQQKGPKPMDRLYGATRETTY